MIKKRTVKAKALKSKRDDENDDADITPEPIPEHLKSSIQLAKLKQKVRSRTNGMKIKDAKTGSFVDDKERERKVRQKEKERKNIIEGGKLGGLIERGRDGSFLFQNKEIRGETQFTSQSKSEVDIKMEEFVESELRKRGYGKDNEEQETKIVNDEAELFQIPDHLRVKDSLFTQDVSEEMKHKEANTRAPKTGESLTIEDERSTVLSGGILEVPISIELRLKNIEETERAKERMKNQEQIASQYGGQNYNMNYNMHHRRYLQEQMQSMENLKEQLERKEADELTDDDYDEKDREDEENFERQTQFSQLKRPSETASDEALLERFKKRFKHNHNR